MVQQLLKGFEEFRKQEYEGDSPSMPRLVREGQHPRFFIISCIDSRVNTGVIFRAKPGMFFAHKAMGAIVRPYRAGRTLAASLQYAIAHCKVPSIIVLGHTQCGAIKALVDHFHDDEIDRFLETAQTPLHKAKSCSHTHDELLATTEKETILQSAENLKTYPCVQQALSERRLEIKVWLFDMKRGQLLEYNADKSEFEIISNTEMAKEKT